MARRRRPPVDAGHERDLEHLPAVLRYAGRVARDHLVRDDHPGDGMDLAGAVGWIRRVRSAAAAHCPGPCPVATAVEAALVDELAWPGGEALAAQLRAPTTLTGADTAPGTGRRYPGPARGVIPTPPAPRTVEHGRRRGAGMTPPIIQPPSG